MKTDAEIAEWHRLAAALVRDLEKAGLTDGRDGAGRCVRGRRLGLGRRRSPLPDRPGGYTTALASVSILLQDKIQDLILKDMVSARDEATPPEFKELVDRYYEVLSKNGGSK